MIAVFRYRKFIAKTSNHFIILVWMTGTREISSCIFTKHFFPLMIGCLMSQVCMQQGAWRWSSWLPQIEMLCLFIYFLFFPHCFPPELFLLSHFLFLSLSHKWMDLLSMPVVHVMSEVCHSGLGPQRMAEMHSDFLTHSPSLNSHKYTTTFMHMHDVST